MNKKVKEFKKEYRSLCEKYQLHLISCYYDPDLVDIYPIENKDDFARYMRQIAYVGDQDD